MFGRMDKKKTTASLHEQDNNYILEQEQSNTQTSIEEEWK
jgi:hypothetical protein